MIASFKVVNLGERPKTTKNNSRLSREGKGCDQTHEAEKIVRLQMLNLN